MDVHRPSRARKLSSIPSDIPGLQRLAEELQTHQVELQAQNQTLRETQHELETSRDRYAALYDSAPVGYATIDEHGAITDANLALAGMLETERGNLLGRQFLNFVILAQRHEVRSFLRLCARTSGRHSCDATFQSPHGRNVIVQLVGERTTSDLVSPQCRVAIVDITEKAEALQSLRESQSMLHTALQAAHMVAWSWDLDSNTVIQSSTLRDIFGPQTPDTYLVHSSLTKDMHPDDIDHYRTAMEKAITEGTEYVVQFRVTPHWQKATFWLEEHGRVIMNPEGQPSAVRGLIFDITVRKVAEEGIKTNYERLEALIRESANPVALLDAEGTIECISRTGALMLGYAPEELSGREAATLLHPDDIRLSAPQRETLRTTGKPASALLRVREKNGRLCWVDADVSVILPDSSSRGYMVAFRRVALELRRDQNQGSTEEGVEKSGAA